MTEINSSSPSIFSYADQLKETSSSPSLSCHIILNKTSLLHGDNHTNGYYHKDIQQPHNQQQGDNFDLSGGSYNIENESESESESGLKLSIWKEEQVMVDTTNENQSAESNNTTTTSIQVKWMSSKMRLMHKMKNNKTDPTATNNAVPLMKVDHEHQKDQDPSSYISPMDQTADSNTTTSASNNSTTIRVCSDCNTTKTPLWRSGPCGPKSLCNACGIRQRKARRAMAAAAATNGTLLLSERSISPMKISKAKYIEKRSNGSKYKKRCNIAATTSHSLKELRFEEFLMSLSKNLALHRMFPQDEKEAAILLMALSCGHIHG